MEIKIRKSNPLETKAPCLVMGVFQNTSPSPELKKLDAKLGGLLVKALRRKEFFGKEGELIVFQPAGTLPVEQLLLVGLGIKEQCTLDSLRQASGRALRRIMKSHQDKAAMALALCDIQSTTIEQRVQAIAEGAILASYRYDKFLSPETRKTERTPSSLTLLIDQPRSKPELQTALDNAQKLSHAVRLARDLVNTPGNIKSPSYLAEQAQAAAKRSNLSCQILDRKDLEKEGFGALLGVAQGSQREPHLIILEHKGGLPDDPPIAFIGKGVVFDAGGISLKPAEKMDEMKMDMAGGAAVIGTLMGAALLALPVNLVGLVPAVENLPSGTAYRPGDILTSLSGQTIEVLNTDAEGRLILADTLTYAKRYNPRLVVDLATLTGACIIALGHHATAVLGNDQQLVQALLEAGEKCGERLWQLPLWPVFDEQIKSTVADMKNIGGKPAGTITAAAFLKKFAQDFTWAHLDIAGTAWRDQDQPYIPKGGTGVGVRLLITFLEDFCRKEQRF